MRDGLVPRGRVRQEPRLVSEAPQAHRGQGQMVVSDPFEACAIALEKGTRGSLPQYGWQCRRGCVRSVPQPRSLRCAVLAEKTRRSEAQSNLWCVTMATRCLYARNLGGLEQMTTAGMVLVSGALRPTHVLSGKCTTTEGATVKRRGREECSGPRAPQPSARAVRAHQGRDARARATRPRSPSLALHSRVTS